MGTDKVVFEGEQWGATGSDATGSDMTGSHVTGSDHVRKCILRMRTRKLRHIRPSGAIWPKVTQSRDRKRPCPEVSLTGSRFCACPDFPPRFFLNSRTGCDQRSLDPFRGSLWVYATGSCATPLVSLGCSLRRPRPITLGNPASYI
jgi:hypothetical protein